MGLPSVLFSSPWPRTPKAPVLIFLGRNPGNQEDKAALPFMGPSGSLLKDTYIHGISAFAFGHVVLANTARCYHLHGSGPKNKHYKACRAHLLVDLDLLGPLASEFVIVTLGAEAATHLYALAGRPGVNLKKSFGMQNTPVKLGAHEARVFSTYHPAHILRTHKVIHAVTDHLQLVLDYFEGRSARPSLPRRIPPRLPRG